MTCQVTVSHCRNSSLSAGVSVWGCQPARWVLLLLCYAGERVQLRAGVLEEQVGGVGHVATFLITTGCDMV